MNDFLNDFLTITPDRQKEQMKKVLEIKEKSGLLRSPAEFQAELQKLSDEIESSPGRAKFQAIHQEEKMDSASYNKNLEDIFTDLSILFEGSNRIQRFLNDHGQISSSMLSEVEKYLNEMNKEISRLEMLLNQSDHFTEGVYEAFESPQYLEENPNQIAALRKDRFGESRNEWYEGDYSSGALQLNAVESKDLLATNYGRPLANIKIANDADESYTVEGHSIDKAIDGSSETYWAQQVLSDDVVKQEVTDLWKGHYEHQDTAGSICEIHIYLNGLSSVSDVQLDPFGAFPLEVLSIVGYEDEINGGKSYDLVSPTHENLHQRSKSGSKRLYFQFGSVDIRAIKIIIRQQNYTNENFIIKEKEANDADVWRNLSINKPIMVQHIETGDNVTSLDLKNEKSGWTTYLEKLKEWAGTVKSEGVLESAKKAVEIIQKGEYKSSLYLMLESMKDASSDKTMETEDIFEDAFAAQKKKAYIYGAYQIKVYGKRYKPVSISVTEPLPLSHSTRKVTLETQEKQESIIVNKNSYDPKNNKIIPTASQITDIEYYLTTEVDPEPKDWRPILPSNQTFIENELLFGDDGSVRSEGFKSEDLIVFTLRFIPASSSTVVVKRNGRPLSKDQFVVDYPGKAVGIKPQHYSATSIYTVTYKPTDEAYLYDVFESGRFPSAYINEKGELGERFNKTDMNNRVRLKEFPILHRDENLTYKFLDEKYEQREQPGDASDNLYFPLIVRVNGEEFENVTDYASNSFKEDDLKKNRGKSFAQIGRDIIFGVPESGEAIENITVDYYYYISHLRMKIIMRRNYAGEESLTPSLYEYRLRGFSDKQEV